MNTSSYIAYQTTVNKLFIPDGTNNTNSYNNLTTVVNINN